MPGPAVYILAVFAAVGTAIIVKEFVYDPHIAPLIQEYRESRRRRRQGPIGVPLQYHSPDTSDDEHGTTKRRFWEKRDHESGSDSEGSSKPLPRKPRRGIDIELEDLVAREIREWSSSASDQGLRQRKKPPQSEINALDEANQRLSFAPISPSRPVNAPQRALSPITSPSVATVPVSTLLQQPGHTMHDSVPNSQHSTTSPTRMTSTRSPTLSTRARPTPSSTRALASPTYGNINASSTSALFSTRDQQSSPVTGSPTRPSPSAIRYSPEQVEKSLPALPRSPPSASTSNEPASMLTLANLRPLSIPMARQISTESSASAASAMTARPPLSPPFGSNDIRPPLPRLPSTPSDATFDDRSSSHTRSSGIPGHASPVASPPHRPVPSLSQSYPQDLDHEQNVVLLSAPSSRSTSPFSVVGSGEGVGSPYVGFSALGEGRGASMAKNDEQATASSLSSPGSQYISLPGSNTTSAPGSPAVRSGQVTASNPFDDPSTPKTPTTAFDLDSDMSDWEHAGVTSSHSPPRLTTSRSAPSTGFESDEEDDGEDDDDMLSDSGMSEASLSSWASVSGRSSNGA